MDIVVASAVVGFAIAIMVAPVLVNVAVFRSGSADSVSFGDAKSGDAFTRDSLSGALDPGHVSRGDYSFTTPSERQSTRSKVAKRVFDVAAASVLLLVSLPILAITALAIRIDSAGPILYRQRRIGLNGKPFEILKLRSMTVDAEKDGARWASVNDARVTRIGRIIRTLHIDEIPQTINVLKGDMSFVGPRPERPEFVEVLEREIPNYQLRHLVKPGLTGWAQVKYVYGASIEDARVKLSFDLFYIKHFSILKDILIVLMTIRVAFFGIGSR